MGCVLAKFCVFIAALVCASPARAEKWDEINRQLGQILFRGLGEKYSNRVCSTSAMNRCKYKLRNDADALTKCAKEGYCDVSCLREAGCTDAYDQNACGGSKVEDCGWSSSVKLITIDESLIGTKKIGELVERGEFYLRDLQCGEISIKDAVLTWDKEQPDLEKKNIDMLIDELKLKCTGDIRIVGLKFGGLDYVTEGILNSLVSHMTTDYIAFGFDNTGSSDPLSLSAGFEFRSTNFKTNRPSGVVVTSCNLDLPASAISLDIGAASSLVPPLLGILKGMIEGIMCDVITQTGEVGSAGSQQNGILGEMIAKLDKAIDDAVDGTQATDLVAEEQRAITEFSAKQLQSFVNITGTKAVGMVEEVVNVGLGAPGARYPWNETLLINQVMSIMTEGTGVAEITSDYLTGLPIKMNTPLSNSSMTLESLRIAGLDTFTYLKLLGTVEGLDYTTHHAVAIDNIDFDARFRIELLPGLWVDPTTVADPHGLVDHFDAKLKLRGVSVNASTLMLVVASRVNDLKVGQIVPTQSAGMEPLGCILSLMTGFSLSEFELKMDDINDPVLSDFLDSGLSYLITNGFDFGVQLFMPSIKYDMPSLSRGVLRSAMNDQLSRFLKSNSACNPYVFPEGLDYVDFAAADAGSVLTNDIISDTLFKKNNVGEYRVNSLIGAMLGTTAAGKRAKLAGGLSFNDIFRVTIDAGKYMQFDSGRGHADIHMTGIHFGNLDTVQVFSVKPADESPTRSVSTSIRMGDGSKGKPLQLHFSFHLEANAYDVAVNDTFTFELSFGALGANADATMEIVLAVLHNMTLGVLSERPVCALASWYTMALAKLDFVTSDSALKVICEGDYYATCDSISMYLDESHAQLGDELNALFEAIANHLTNENWAKLFAGITRDLRTSCVPGYVKSAPPSEDGWSPDSIAITISAAVGAVLLLGMSALAYRHVYRRREARAKSEESYEPALVADPRVSRNLRYGIPLLIVVHIIIFISCNVDVGGTVDMKLTVLSDDNPRSYEEVNIKNLFAFTLAGSIQDMWHAKVYLLAVVIVTASGMWPYLKLLILGYCWCAPTHIMSAKSRGRCVGLLDVLGKWSVIDQFMMIVMMQVFRIKVDVPSSTALRGLFPPDFGPGDFLVVDVFLTPRWGFYGFLMAALGTIVIGEIIMLTHRNLATPGWLDHSGTNLHFKKLPLMSHHFVIQGGTVVLRRAARVGLFLIMLGVSIFFVVAAVTNAFTFSVDGLAGLALNAIKPGNSRKTMSLASTALTLSEQAGPDVGSFIGITFIQFVFLLATLVVPLVQLCSLMFVWSVPLRIGLQKKVLFFVELLSGWAASEVFLGAVLAAYLQLGQFAAFMVGDACAELDTVLQSYFYPAGIVSEAEATCFNVSAELLDGFIVLVVGILLCVITISVTARICSAAVRQSENAEAATTEKQSMFASLVGSCLLRLLLCTHLATCGERYEEFDEERPTQQLPAAKERERGSSKWLAANPLFGFQLAQRKPKEQRGARLPTSPKGGAEKE